MEPERRRYVVGLHATGPGGLVSQFHVISIETDYSFMVPHIRLAITTYRSYKAGFELTQISPELIFVEGYSTWRYFRHLRVSISGKSKGVIGNVEKARAANQA